MDYRARARNPMRALKLDKSMEYSYLEDNYQTN